jgi:hypothetical protein
MADNNGHEADALPTGEFQPHEVQLLRRIMHEYKVSRKELHAVIEFVKGKEQWGRARRMVWKVFAGAAGTIGILAALRNDLVGLIGWIFHRGP